MDSFLFRLVIPFLLLCLACNDAVQTTDEPSEPFVRHADFSSQYIAARHIDVHLPPDYGDGKSIRYPVLYMHDGQNIFTSATAYGGVEWQADEILDSLTRIGATRACIIVGIWNSDKRFPEYLPQQAAEQLPQEVQDQLLEYNQNVAVFSDQYLRFLVEELMPFINKEYRTLTGPAHTFVAGSSMGGLVSLYALCRYPDHFGGAACLSTHWPVDLEARYPIFPITLTNYFGTQLPDASAHKIYFDYGTQGLDAHYEPWQLRMDSLMNANGYTQGQNWITRKFEGHDHSEGSWAKRFWEPLVFMLPKQ
ncbi:MAG: alpha/beta fold hydrolase [Bacteroidota bacterium]